MTRTVDSKQLKRIKLNITNIRSSLVDANKTLANLRAEKKLLFKKQIEDKKLKDKEKKLEKTPVTSLGKAVNAPIKSAKSFIDKVVQLGATILVGQLVTAWPKLMENFKKWKENNKAIIGGVVKTFQIIGSGITGFVKWIGGINTDDIDKRTSQIDKETAEVEKNIDVVAIEAEDALGNANQKDESSATPDNDSDTKQTKQEKDPNKNINEPNLNKTDSKKSKPDLSGGTSSSGDMSGEKSFPLKQSKLQTPNASKIKALNRNQIDSILATPSGQFSPIAQIPVTNKVKSEIRQHLTNISIKSVSRQKNIDTLNSMKTGNGKGKTTIIVATQTKEKIVPVTA